MELLAYYFTSFSFLALISLINPSIPIAFKLSGFSLLKVLPAYLMIFLISFSLGRINCLANTPAIEL